MKLREDKALKEWLQTSISSPASKRLETRFDQDATPRKGTEHLLENGDLLVRCEPGATLLLELMDDKGHLVLTSNAEQSNHCVILFPHGYRRARCDMSIDRFVTPTHIGFLGLPPRKQIMDLPELQSSTLQGSNGGQVRAALEFFASPPQEIIGLVWRGGRVKFERIVLEP